MALRLQLWLDLPLSEESLRFGESGRQFWELLTSAVGQQPKVQRDPGDRRLTGKRDGGFTNKSRYALKIVRRKLGTSPAIDTARQAVSCICLADWAPGWIKPL